VRLKKHTRAVTYYQ
jgi:hypothetical protein